MTYERASELYELDEDIEVLKAQVNKINYLAIDYVNSMHVQFEELTHVSVF